MAFALRCPDCRKSFPWDVKAAYPRYCPLCQADLGEEKDDNVICMPAFLSAKTKANDQVYRDIERSSEVRMEKAAEAAGVSVSEMSSLKITNINDTRHEGAIAAVPVNNAVTQQMEAANAKGGQFGFAGSNGAEFAAGISTGDVTVNGHTTRGIAPRAGANTLAAIQRSNGLR